MKNWKLVVLPAIAGVLLLLTGCASTSQSAKEPVVAPEAPPPAQAEELTMSPGPGYVWVPGVWIWRDHWDWVSGRWMRAPRPNALWVSGYWQKADAGYVWVPGSWQ